MVGEGGAGAIEDEHPQPAPHRVIIEAAMQTNDLRMARLVYQSFLKATKATVEDR